MVLGLGLLTCSEHEPFSSRRAPFASARPLRVLASAAPTTSTTGTEPASVMMTGRSSSLRVCDWLRRRRVAASQIIAPAVPPAWLCPRRTAAPTGPECVLASVGAPAQEGLICTHSLDAEDNMLKGSKVLTVWRLEGTSLRQVFEAFIVVDLQVRIDEGTRLSLVDRESIADYALVEISQKSSLGFEDPPSIEFFSRIARQPTEYLWNVRNFQARERHGK